MAYVALEETKEYCGIYYSEKDAEVALMIDAAERHVASFLGKPLSEALVDNSDDSVPDLDPELLPTVKLSILQHVAGWFEARRINSEAPLQPNEAALQMLHFERTGLGV